MEIHLKSTLVNKQLIDHLRINFFMEKGGKKNKIPLCVHRFQHYPKLFNIISFLPDVSS